MGFKPSHLYAAPAVNPVTLKAQSIPFLNPIDPYGRVFFFSWFGFMIAFWAWYTFPPLLTHTIKNDLHLSSEQVANSNIISLCATLLVRLVSGPLCDRYGPRKLFGGLLLAGSVPLGLAPLVRNATGLYLSRFFIGLIGGVFVPSQVWCMAFFDDNVVGTANGIAGGWGVAGGGVTYLIMPAVYDGLVSGGHSPSQAWRLTFLVPLAMVITTAVALLLLCPDAPTGKWSDRHIRVQDVITTESGSETDQTIVVDGPGGIKAQPILGPLPPKQTLLAAANINAGSRSDLSNTLSPLGATTATPIPTEKESRPPSPARPQPRFTTTDTHPRANLLSLQTAFHMLCYGCTFGSELAINAVLSSYYAATFPSLSQTTASNYAAMFGFLDFVARPLGGIVSDLLYRFASRSKHRKLADPDSALWFKKGWVTLCTLGAGAMLVIVGRLYDGPSSGNSEGGAVALIALAAVFMQASSGANFSLLPHVPDPLKVGALAGLTGASGNLGGVIFAIVFRFMDGGEGYAKGFWVIGLVNLAVAVGAGWIPPLPSPKRVKDGATK
ncbi:hypothetical protein VTJ83DRAFT_2277 [Remersonia thermophila]|uniref:Nitrate/nitrite transporter n=1 Tax=Remersonia thermophila TaxID=72144 RepID=A0ABR4DI95_9PEZI